MGERFRSDEEGLSKVVTVNTEEAGDGRNIRASILHGGEAKGASDVTKAGTIVTGSSFREIVLGEEGDKAAAVTYASHQISSQVQATSGGKSEHVIIAGDSNLVRCVEAIKERAKGDNRVSIGTFPGHTLGSVMRQASEKLAAKAHRRNLVVIAGGLNDVLNKESSGLATTLVKGVDDMSVMSPQVQIVVCTVPEVPVRNGNLQRAAANASKEIWRMSQEKGF